MSTPSTGRIDVSGDIALMTPLLAVDNLHLWYDAGGNVVRAVDGVSFTIERRGEAIGIVGESGSGKSSLALALMRLLPRTSLASMAPSSSTAGS